LCRARSPERLALLQTALEALDRESRMVFMKAWGLLNLSFSTMIDVVSIGPVGRAER
jgi:hypothetical protein